MCLWSPTVRLSPHLGTQRPTPSDPEYSPGADNGFRDSFSPRLWKYDWHCLFPDLQSQPDLHNPSRVNKLWLGSSFASVFKYPSTFFIWAKRQGTNIVTQCLIVVTSSSSFGCLLSLLIFALTFTSLKIMLKICPKDWRPCVRALRPLKICGPLTENPAVEGPLYLISCQPLFLPWLNSRRIFKNGGRQECVQCLMWNRPGLGSQLERGWESSGNKGSHLAGRGHRGARSPVKCEAHPSSYLLPTLPY